MSQNSYWGGIVDGPALATDDAVGALSTQRVANNLLHWHDQSAQVLVSGYGATSSTIPMVIGRSSGPEVWVAQFPVLGPFWLRVRPDQSSFRVRIKAHAFYTSTPPTPVPTVRLYAVLHRWSELNPQPELGLDSVARWTLSSTDPGTWLGDPDINTGGTTGDTIHLTDATAYTLQRNTLEEIGGDQTRLQACAVGLTLLASSTADTAVDVQLSNFYAAEVAG